MGNTNGPSGPRRTLLLIGAVVIAIAAVGAAAGAIILMDDQSSQRASNEESSGIDDSGADESGADDRAADETGASDNGVDNGTSNETPAVTENGSNEPLSLNNLKQGDYVEFSASSSVLGLSQSGTVRLVVTSASASGYDIVMTITSGSGVEERPFHVGNTQELISGVAGDSFSRGTLIGDGVISTVYGDKNVEHWRSTTIEGGTTNVTDYYVGKSTGMVYKAVITSTRSDLLSVTTTTKLDISNTNISWVMTGDA